MGSLRSSLKLITFDVTNTLLKFKIPVGVQYAKAARIFGIERDPDQITAAFLENWKFMNTTYPNFGCNLGISSQTWWRILVSKAFSNKEHELSCKELDAVSNHLFAIYSKNVCWDVVPGAISLLQSLKAENMRLGVISNFDERLESVLCANDLNCYFDFVLASYVVQVAKPNKEIFNLALSKSSVAPFEALHVGDDVKLDYKAAKSAGWNAVLISKKLSLGNPPENDNHIEVVEDISQLNTYIFSKF